MRWSTSRSPLGWSAQVCWNVTAPASPAAILCSRRNLAAPSRDRSTRASVSSGRARSRPQASQRPRARSGGTDQAFTPSLSVGARQSAGSGPRTSTLRPSQASRSMLPCSRSSSRRARGAWSRTRSASTETETRPPARGVGRRPRARHGMGSCSQAISWPFGAQGRSRAVSKRTVSQHSSPGESTGRRSGSSTSRWPPGGTRSAGSRPRCTTRPSTSSSKRPRSQERSTKSCLLRMRISPRPRRRASTATGWASFLNSCIAGWGVRSGQTRPLMQKFRSLGSSPKSPP